MNEHNTDDDRSNLPTCAPTLVGPLGIDSTSFGATELLVAISAFIIITSTQREESTGVVPERTIRSEVALGLTGSSRNTWYSTFRIPAQTNPSGGIFFTPQ